MTSQASKLAVRSGCGRLLRTPTAVLFTPAEPTLAEPTLAEPTLAEPTLAANETWAALVAALRDAPQPGTAPVAGVLAERGLVAPPLVYVSWVPRVAILVFGDVEVTTDHPSVPLLSGRESRTWVEHSMPVPGGAVAISVSAPDEHDTDLLAGIVPADGFRLLIEFGTSAVPDTAPAVTVAPLDADRDTPPRPVEPPAQPEPPQPAPAPQLPPRQPSPAPPGEPERELPAMPASWRTTDLPASPTDPPAPGATSDDAAPPGGPPATLAAVAGILELDDGTSIVVERETVLGRRPRDPHAALVTVAGDRVSRSHARLLVEGTAVSVRDLGSRNGTYVSYPGQQEVTQVGEHVPLRLEDGMTLFLGSRSLHFRRPGPGD